MIPFPFPTVSIGLSYAPKVIGTNNFGDDIIDRKYEVVTDILLAPQSTNDQTRPHENMDANYIEVHFPATFSGVLRASSFKVLTGANAGREFEIQGDPLAYEGSPVPWNRMATAVEVYR